MRSLRAVRVRAPLAMALAALGVVMGVPGAVAATPAAVPRAVPTVVLRDGRVTVAWTSGGIVQVASRSVGGRWSRGVAVGRALGEFGARSPQLAIAPDGEQVLVWQSGHRLRSAWRASGKDAWSVETLARVGSEARARLVMDGSGRAVVAWVDSTRSGASGSLLVRFRPAGGPWTEASVLTTSAFELSIGSERGGAVVVAYVATVANGVEAIVTATLPPGSSSWSTSVISGSDVVTYGPDVAGGGAATIVVSWMDDNEAGPHTLLPGAADIARVSRLRLPGAWSEPRNAVPLVTYAAYAPIDWVLNHVTAVDGFGNALMVWRYGYGLAAARLPASGEEWTAPVTIDVPADSDLLDSTPALGMAADGSATVAFVRAEAGGIGLRVTSAHGALGAWQTRSTRIARLSSCTQCQADWDVPPVLAVSPRLSAIVVSGPAGMVAVTRSARGGPWTKPVTLEPADATNAYLRSAHVRQGVVRALATCALPPCHGVAVLRTTAGIPRILGRVRFAIKMPITASAGIRLPRWAQARLAHGAHLRAQLEFNVHERDGTNEQTLLTVRLHG